MEALRTQLTEARRSFNNANARAWALQAQAATLETRLALANTNSRAPAPIQGIEYNLHTLKARLRGVYAELSIADADLRSDLSILRELQADAEFLGIANEGTPAGAAFDAIGRVHDRLKSSAGIVECAICYEPITTENVMIGKNCHHLFCASCVESNMEAVTDDGVGNMRCPLRCAGVFCNREHWANFQQAKQEVSTEGDVADVVLAVVETADEKFNGMVERRELVLVGFDGPGGSRWEEVIDGPRATSNKRKLEEDPTAHKKKLFLSRQTLKKVSQPFTFSQANGGNNQVEAWKETFEACGRDRAWVRRV